MSGFSGFIAEIQDIVSAQLNVPLDAVFTSIQMAKQSLTNDIAAGNLPLPLVIIELGRATPDTEFGVDEFSLKRSSLMVHKLCQWGPINTQDVISDEMTAFIYFMDYPKSLPYDGSVSPFPNNMQPQTFELIEQGVVDTDISESINAQLFVDSKVQYISAAAIWEPGPLINTAAS